MINLRRGLSFLMVLTMVSALSAQEPSEILEQIRSATLDPERAVAVKSLQIDLGLAQLNVDEGWVVPARPIQGHTAEMVFVGRARVHLEPPDEIEAHQLELFTGGRTLDVEIQQALLVLGNPSVSEALLSRDSTASIDSDALAQATGLFESWVGGAERKGLGVGAAVFNLSLGDPTYRSYVTAVFDSDELERFYYLFDPAEREQITVGQFVPLELDDVERHRAQRQIAREKRRGRALQLRLGDLGDWDTWLQTSQRDSAGRIQPGGMGFEPKHYSIDATVDPGEQRIESRVGIDLVAADSGRRTLQFTLASDLRPAAVTDGQGSDLPWFRSDSDLYVLLPEAVEVGAEVHVEIAYSGVFLFQIEKGVLRQISTLHWYPRSGSDDRATYDVTLRYPRGVSLLGSGRVVESKKESGLRVERRVLEVPSFGFSFEVGDFDIVTEQVGHVELTVGFSKSTLAEDSGNPKKDVLDTLKSALAFYETTFGAYPLDQLTVATIPRGFSQGALSFLTLSHHLLAAEGGLYYVGQDHAGNRQRQRVETVAHELSHQWWGNKVGWYNYRDQWLSEALADYSAVLFAANQSQRKSLYLAQHARNWKSSLRDQTRDGRTVESLGPVVLGNRLDSSLSTRARQAVVYDKGSVVFTMLASILKQDKLNEMLREVADRLDNRPIDTETFIAALERMSGFDLSTFARQFVYGTGVPEIYYEYNFSPGSDGSWTVEGEAQMVAPADYRYTLRRAEGWDVTRQRVDTMEISEWALLVPFQLTLAGSGSSGGGRAVGRGLGGNMVIRGESTPFAFPIKQKPLNFWLDQRGEVLGYFYCENRQPKRMLLYQAYEQQGDQAARTLQRALEAPFFSEQAQAEVELSKNDLERQERLLDARIHLLLARLQLDQRDPAAARASLKTAEKLIPALDADYYRATRTFIQARSALQEGNYGEAYKQCRTLRLHFPRKATDTTADDLRRNRWREGWTGRGEAYAVLAIAAYETDHRIVALQATEEAERRGADMTILNALLAAPRD